MNKIKYLLLRWSGVALFLILWEAAPHLGWIDPYFLPAFSTVLGSITDLAKEGALMTHILVSLWRGVLGLVVAAGIGIPAGFVLGRRFPAAGEILSPLLRLLSQVNPFSLLPVFLLFFGIGETAKIAVVGWVSLWPILFYTMTAVRTVDPLLVKTALSLGIEPSELYLKVLLPGALPTVFTGVRLGAGLVFFMLVAAEMLGANGGVGWLVHNSAMNFQISRMYAGASCIIVLGYLLNRGLLLLEEGLFVFSSTRTEIFTQRPVSFGIRLGRRSAWGATAAVLVLTLAGGYEVHRINEEAKTGHQGHHGKDHLPTPDKVEAQKELDRSLDSWDAFGEKGGKK